MRHVFRVSSIIELAHDMFRLGRDLYVRTHGIHLSLSCLITKKTRFSHLRRRYVGNLSDRSVPLINLKRVSSERLTFN